MDKKEIQDLLDKTYELEGLLHLATARSEDMPEVLPGLIRAKVADLYEMIGNVPVSGQIVEEVESETVMEEPLKAQPEQVIEEPAEEHNHHDAEEPAEEPHVHKMNGVFSLNDRFLFIRELFNGNGAAFDNALTTVAGMDSFAEAEEYFYDECGMNPADPSVEAFMRIIEKCF